MAAMASPSTMFANGTLDQEALQHVVPADWRYEMRRTAQEIIPGLFVGPYQSSTKLEPLQQDGITHILVVTDDLFLRPRFPDQFVYKVVTVRDAQDQNLIRLFPEATTFIRDALASNGRVLVHCGDGISRSPAIVTAYVMQAYNLKQEDAFSYVQARRFCVAPNQGFQHQLEAYQVAEGFISRSPAQHIHEAQVAISLDKSAGLRDVRRKRSGSEDDGDEPAGKRAANELEIDDMQE